MNRLISAKPYVLLKSLTLGILLIGASAAVQAQESAEVSSYPSKPIRLVVPYPPGGASDAIGRLVAERLSDAVGQSVVVENKAGAGGTLGSTFVARSKPDGYTLCICAATSLTIGHLLYPAAANALDELTPIMTAAGFPFVLAVGEKSPAQTASDIIILAKDKGDSFNIGALPEGTPSRMNGEVFKRNTGNQAVIVPYNGTNQALPALISGDIDMLFDAPSVFMPHLPTGRVRALAVAQPERLADLPDVPTLKELGLGDVSFSAWYALVAPHGTPEAIVSKLEEALRGEWDTPEVRKVVQSRGLLHYADGSAATLERMRTESEVSAALIEKK